MKADHRSTFGGVGRPAPSERDQAFGSLCHFLATCVCSGNLCLNPKGMEYSVIVLYGIGPRVGD
jgi:hypothetical protein